VRWVSVDLVVSSMAIHNIRSYEGRRRAIAEAARVLKPGGRLLIADIVWTTAYAKRLRELGMENVVRQRLDWRFWYGALGGTTGLASATKQESVGPAGAYRE